MRAAAELGGADALLLPIGWTADKDEVVADPSVAERLLRTNLVAVIALVTELLGELSRRPRAAVVGFGSVASVRGRGSNVVYAASKRALQTYFEGLRHACAGTSVRVSFYVLGYLDTSLAFGRRTPLPRADPGAARRPGGPRPRPPRGRQVLSCRLARRGRAPAARALCALQAPQVLSRCPRTATR